MDQLFHIKNIKNKYSIATITLLTLYSIFIILISFRLFFESNIYSLASNFQDDSFYYLVPAFNFVKGHGFTFGGIKSYGFEPGYGIFLTILANASNSIQSLIRISAFTNSILFTTTAFVIYFTVSKIQSFYLGNRINRSCIAAGSLLASIIFLANTWNYLNSTTPMENALAALILSLILLMAFSGQNNNKFYSVIFGMLCGVLILIRPSISSIFYIIVIFLVFRKSFFILLSGACIVTFPWLLFAYIYFGSPIPYSALVKASEHTHNISINILFKEAFRYLKNVIEVGFYGDNRFHLPEIYASKAFRANFVFIILSISLLLSTLGLSLLSFKKCSLKNAKSLLFPLIIIAMLSGAFVMGVAVLLKRPGELYYYSWYVYSPPVIISLFVGVGMSYLMQFILQRFNSFNVVLSSSTVIILFVVIIGLSCNHYYEFKPYTLKQYKAGIGKRWQNTMISAGLWYKRHIHNWQDKTVVAYSAGALNWILDNNVVNLDGLANDQIAKLKITNHSPNAFKRYINRLHPNYLIDIKQMSVPDKNINSSLIHLIPFKHHKGYQITHLSYSKN